MCPSVSFSLAKNASREETRGSGRFLAGRGVFFNRSVVVGITLSHPVSKKSLRLLKKKMNSRTDDYTCWLMWYFMSTVIFNRLTILFRITSYASWLRNGNKLFVTGAQICWIYNQELSLKLRFLVWVCTYDIDAVILLVRKYWRHHRTGGKGVGRMGSKQGEI